MTDGDDAGDAADAADEADAGWFAGVEPGAVEAGAAAIRDGEADEPRDWPRTAVESGRVDSEAAYYDWLREATVRAARDEVRERERASDQQLIHCVRAMDDCERTANELAERLAEWAGTLRDDAGTGVEYARELAATDDRSGPGPGGASDERASADATAPVEERLVSLARRVADLADEADELRSFVEEATPGVAPNLSALAGPVLAARLIALAGGLESLARTSSSTVQVLGAEDALFAHLRGSAPSPKHGVIFVHEYVRGTRPEERGSAARALAGKLAIAARVDHYSGERKPEIDAELDERIRTIRERGSGGDGA